MTPHSKTHKRHAALSFRRDRETIVVGIIFSYFTQVSIILAGTMKNY